MGNYGSRNSFFNIVVLSALPTPAVAYRERLSEEIFLDSIKHIKGSKVLGNRSAAHSSEEEEEKKIRGKIFIFI